MGIISTRLNGSMKNEDSKIKVLLDTIHPIIFLLNLNLLRE